MEQRSILFVVLLLGNGGVERVITHLANGFARAGYRVGVFSILPCEDYSRFLDPNITTYCFGKRISAPLNKYRAAKMLATIGEQYDVVLSGLFLTGLDVVYLSKYLSRKRSQTRHLIRVGTCLSGIPDYQRRFSRRANFIYPRLDGIISVSNGIEEDTKRIIHRPVKNIVTIYNPIDTESIARMAAEPVSDVSPQQYFVNAGRLTSQKDQATLLRAFARFQQLTGRQDFHLVILGRGPRENDLKQLAGELQLTNVHFLGFAENPWKYMRQATAFVLSSQWEGLPNVVLEAMACGTPVISTDCPTGPAELLQQGKNGYLVPMADHEELAKAMASVVTCPDEVQQKVENAHEFIRSLSIPAVVRQYAQVLFPEEPTTY